MIIFEAPYIVAAIVVVLFLFVGASLVGLIRSALDNLDWLFGRWLLVLLPSLLGLVGIFMLMDQVNLCVGTP
jgi:hypothetical protein